MANEYRRDVATFAETGGELIQDSIGSRYAGAVPANPERPLEPGFVPPLRRPRIVAVSHYPNDGNLDGKVPDYGALRDNFARWGADRTIESYEIAYDDWLHSVDVIPFHRAHTLDVLLALGIGPDEIAWLPLVKAPMRPQSRPRMSVVGRDLPVTMAQLQLLSPTVVWVQGIVAYDRVGTQVRERITPCIVKQNISPWRSAELKRDEIDRVVENLKKCLGR